MQNRPQYAPAAQKWHSWIALFFYPQTTNEMYEKDEDERVFTKYETKKRFHISSLTFATPVENNNGKSDKKLSPEITYSIFRSHFIDQTRINQSESYFFQAKTDHEVSISWVVNQFTSQQRGENSCKIN